jgi:hypothetical protein
MANLIRAGRPPVIPANYELFGSLMISSILSSVYSLSLGFLNSEQLAPFGGDPSTTSKIIRMQMGLFQGAMALSCLGLIQCWGLQGFPEHNNAIRVVKITTTAIAVLGFGLNLANQVDWQQQPQVLQLSQASPTQLE